MLSSLAILVVEKGTLTAEEAVVGLSETYPWKWEWQVKDLGNGRMMVKFPSAARVEEARCYPAFALKETNALVSVKRWSTEAMAKGKLDTAWVRIGGVSDELKHYFDLCEVGSMIGVVLDVDMSLFRKQEIVRLKVGVKDVALVPAVAELIVDLFSV